MMGADGLTAATEAAILERQLHGAPPRPALPRPLLGPRRLVAHECISTSRHHQGRPASRSTTWPSGSWTIGFHAPTMSFPVAGTLMVEPTESESLAEIDRFCDAMIAIRAEIDRVAAGDGPSRTARCATPLTPQPSVIADTGTALPASTQAAYRRCVDGPDKYWPPVSRIDGAYGDKNLVCSCPPLSAYET